MVVTTAQLYTMDFADDHVSAPQKSESCKRAFRADDERLGCAIAEELLLS